MKKVVLLVSCVALACSASAFAGSYKSAGCGLGSMIIKDDGIVQIFAATTNGTFGSQTFGITSGTSNCTGSGGYAKADAEQEMYVSSNQDAISQEMAQGSGEHLTALSTLMGCEKGSSDQFATAMKRNYRTIASEKNPEDMISSMKGVISSDPALKKACNS
jgi:hypothetical protein